MPGGERSASVHGLGGKRDFGDVAATPDGGDDGGGDVVDLHPRSCGPKVTHGPWIQRDPQGPVDGDEDIADPVRAGDDHHAADMSRPADEALADAGHLDSSTEVDGIRPGTVFAGYLPDPGVHPEVGEGVTEGLGGLAEPVANTAAGLAGGHHPREGEGTFGEHRSPTAGQTFDCGEPVPTGGGDRVGVSGRADVTPSEGDDVGGPVEAERGSPSAFGGFEQDGVGDPHVETGRFGERIPDQAQNRGGSHGGRVPWSGNFSAVGNV